jgi:hypothetical protein
VFRADLTGVSSLEIVRLLNRMIKERRFNVHPDVLTCLAHLRLKTELGVRASDTQADKPQMKTMSRGRAAARRANGKKTEQPHLSKKAKQVLKERKEIEKEMDEAAAEVDKEERASNVSGPGCSETSPRHTLTCLSAISCSKPKRSSCCLCCTSGSSRTLSLLRYYRQR